MEERKFAALIYGVDGPRKDNGNIEHIYRVLLDNPALIHSTHEVLCDEYSTIMSRTLHLAIVFRHVPLAKLLIDEGIRNSMDKRAFLWDAVNVFPSNRICNRAMVEFLLDYPEELSRGTKEEFTNTLCSAIYADDVQFQKACVRKIPQVIVEFMETKHKRFATELQDLVHSLTRSSHIVDPLLRAQMLMQYGATTCPHMVRAFNSVDGTGKKIHRRAQLAEVFCFLLGTKALGSNGDLLRRAYSYLAY